MAVSWKFSEFLNYSAAKITTKMSTSTTVPSFLFTIPQMPPFTPC